MSSLEPSSSSSLALAPNKMPDGMCNDIAIEIKTMLGKVEAHTKSGCCICKVPPEIQKLDEDVYIPKVISIGPFHHQNPILQKMESQKKIYLKRLLQRTDTKVDSLVSRLKELELEVRRCYSEDINFLKEDFIKMILLDAGFIIEFFYMCYYWSGEGDDPLLLKTWLRDLCLLENQLPFFVLAELYNLAFDKFQRDEVPTFLTLTFHVFASQNKQKLAPILDTVYHFTDLLRTFRIRIQLFERPLEDRVATDLDTVSKLCEAGIKFTENRKSKCLLNLQFSGSTLKIPQLRLDDETEILFCNMIALEQCHYPLQQSITDYAYVLSCLIKTKEDADVLVKNGIIVNYLDHSNNMAKLFYRLGKKAPLLSLNSIYYPLLGELKEFFQKPKTRMVAAFRRDYYLDLKHTYCKTPLQTFATLGGIFLLILAAIQTVCSILQVV